MMAKELDELSYNEAAELLGGGSFGNVFVGELECRKVAAKRIQRTDCDNILANNWCLLRPISC